MPAAVVRASKAAAVPGLLNGLGVIARLKLEPFAVPIEVHPSANALQIRLANRTPTVHFLHMFARSPTAVNSLAR